MGPTATRNTLARTDTKDIQKDAINQYDWTTFSGDMVTIEVGSAIKKEFRVLKNVLVSHSDVFKAMLDGMTHTNAAHTH